MKFKGRAEISLADWLEDASSPTHPAHQHPQILLSKLKTIVLEGLLIPYRFHILRRAPSPPIRCPISGNEPSAGNFTLALPIVQRFPSCQMIGIAPVVNFTPAVCEYPWVTFPTTASARGFLGGDAHTCMQEHMEREQEGASR